MKKSFILLFSVLVISHFSAQAQKFAYVDTEYILEQVPEYKSAQKKLDLMAEDWQKDLEKQKTNIERFSKIVILREKRP